MAAGEQTALKCFRLAKKDRTKTDEDRIVELCPHAVQVLKRQLALWARLQLAGKIHHEHLFFRESGLPIRNLNDR